MEESKIKDFEISLDTISNTGFLKRVFNWSSVKEDLSQLKIIFSELGRENSKYENENQILSKDLTEIKQKLRIKEAEEKKTNESMSKLTSEKNTLEKRNDDLGEQKSELREKLSSLETENKRLGKEVEKKIQSYEELSEKYNQKLDNLQEKEKKEIEDYHRKLKSSWSQHEDRVKGAVKAIAERLGITYVPTDKFEYSGKPDSSVVIADEYVIFDAKSPSNPEELHNFPTYLKNQSASAKKYAKHQGVKKDIYLVVPENTLESIEQFYYEEVDYRTHIITIQSLESVLRSLFKIEEYKTITDLNPEDRENLCRIIGKLLHVSKRRIQVDAFFGTVLQEILKESETDVPEEMQDRIKEYETSDKYNPKREDKAKAIPATEIQSSVKEMQTVAFGQEINTNKEDLKQIDSIPLKSKK